MSAIQPVGRGDLPVAEPETPSSSIPRLPESQGTYSDFVSRLATVKGLRTARTEHAVRQIEKHLHTGITDWTVTNLDTKRALDELEGLSPQEWWGALAALGGGVAVHHESSPFHKLVERGLKDSQPLLDRFHQQATRNISALLGERFDLSANRPTDALGVPERAPRSPGNVAMDVATTATFGLAPWLLYFARVGGTKPE